MQFSNTKTYNFEGSIRGMRNPMNSWDKSDSLFGIVDIYDSAILSHIVMIWKSLINTMKSYISAISG